MSNLYSLDYEKSLIAGLLAYPDSWGDIAGFVKGSDLTTMNGAVFTVLAQELEGGGEVSPVIVGAKLSSYGVSFEDVNPTDYLNSLTLIPVKKTEIKRLGEEIVKLRVLRDYEARANDIKKELPALREKSFDAITDFVDSQLAGVNISYYRTNEVDLFANIEEIVEHRAANPIEPDKLGLQGPFPTWNRILGSPSVRGGVCLVGARTGGQKSSLAFYYNTFLAEKYDLPVLHLDAGEMTPEEIQMRAICCLSQGRVPLWAVETGKWAQNKEWASIVRSLWPRVKKIRTTYIDVSMLSYSEIVSEIRRFYYRKVGRNAPEGKGRLLVNWDYIKPQVSTDKNRQEYQDLGIAMRDFKALLTNEIDGSGWASIQNNRMGIYSGKPNAAINDSDEVFSGSDRLVQQATMAFVSRFKTPEAIADEGGLFGNMCLTCVKHRRLLGRDFQQQLDPVLLPSGDSVKNQYYLESRGFHFEDKGDLRMMLERRGQRTLVTEPVQQSDGEII